MSREKRKPTIREVERNMSIMASRIDEFLNMFVREIEKHNTIISLLLEKLELMDKQTCSSCSGVIRTPLLDGIEFVDDCPYCDSPLNETKQTKLEEYGEEE